jgi:Ring finger domain
LEIYYLTYPTPPLKSNQLSKMRCNICGTSVECVIECQCETSRRNLLVLLDKIRSFRNKMILYYTDVRKQNMLREDFVDYLDKSFTMSDFKYLFRIYGIEGYNTIRSKASVVQEFYRILLAGELRIQPLYSSYTIPNDLKAVYQRYNTARIQYLYNIAETERVRQQDEERVRQQTLQQQEERGRDITFEERIAWGIQRGILNVRQEEWISVEHPPQPPKNQLLRMKILDDYGTEVPESITCSICLEDVDSKTVCKTNCGHMYHHTCLVSSMKMMTNHQDDCPMCRARVQHIYVTKLVALDILTNQKNKNKYVDIII